MKKWVLVLILLVSVGCDDPDNGSVTVIGPSSVTAPPAFRNGAFMVQHSILDALLIPDAVCPARPPFLAPINLGFRGDGRSDLFLSGVQMQFVDRTGVHGGSMTFGRTDLVHHFGSLALPAFGTRFFPFAFPFGCAGLPTGTLNVVVFAGDSFGRENRFTLNVPVR